jgi:hypothetical protein
LNELERLSKKSIRTLDELIILAYAVPELVAKVRELEERAEKAEGRLGDCRLMRNLEHQKIAELQAELRKRR